MKYIVKRFAALNRGFSQLYIALQYKLDYVRSDWLKKHVLSEYKT